MQWHLIPRHCIILSFGVAPISCCRLVEEHPTLLDVKAFEVAVNDAKHVIPGLDVSHMMRYNPALIFGFQRGSQMIPYDEVPTQAAPKDFV